MGRTSSPRSPALPWMALCVALMAACPAEEKPGAPAAEKGPAGVPAVDAAVFYRDYASLKGAALLEKYSAGVVVTGAIMKRVDGGGDEGVQLWLAVDGPGHIAVKFQDGGAVVREKKIQAGEIVTVSCQINGKPAEVLFLVDCALK